MYILRYCLKFAPCYGEITAQRYKKINKIGNFTENIMIQITLSELKAQYNEIIEDIKKMSDRIDEYFSMGELEMFDKAWAQRQELYKIRQEIFSQITKIESK